MHLVPKLVQAPSRIIQSSHRPTRCINKPTDKVTYRVTCTRLKHENVKNGSKKSTNMRYPRWTWDTHTLKLRRSLNIYGKSILRQIESKANKRIKRLWTPSWTPLNTLALNAFERLWIQGKSILRQSNLRQNLEFKDLLRAPELLSHLIRTNHCIKTYG